MVPRGGTSLHGAQRRGRPGTSAASATETSISIVKAVVIVVGWRWKRRGRLREAGVVTTCSARVKAVTECVVVECVVARGRRSVGNGTGRTRFAAAACGELTDH